MKSDIPFYRQHRFSSQTKKRKRKNSSLEHVVSLWYGKQRGSLEIEAQQRPAKSVGDMIPRIMESFNNADHSLLRHIVEVWQEKMSSIVQYASPRYIRGKVLYIEVHESSWRFHLETNLKEDIRECVQGISEGKLSDIRFIAGGKTRRSTADIYRKQ